MDKFYFYSSYARPICKLNHNEAGQVIKAMCAFIFHDKEPSEKTLPKAKALFYLLYEQLSEAKKKQIKSAKRGIECFTFTASLAKFFEAPRRRDRRHFNQAMFLLYLRHSTFRRERKRESC